MAISIVFEGPEGSGKSLQANLLAKFLKEHGFPTLLVREPGGTELGEKVREILKLNPDMDPLTHLLLFSAVRNELMVKEVRPWMADHPYGIAVGDRCWWSSLALQSVDGVEATYIRNVQRPFRWYPNLIGYIDLHPKESKLRVAVDESSLREKWWRDDQPLEVYEQVRNNYLSLVRENRGGTLLIDGFEKPWEILSQTAKCVLAESWRSERIKVGSYSQLINELTPQKLKDFCLKEMGLEGQKMQERMGGVRQKLGYPTEQELRNEMRRDWERYGFVEGIPYGGVERR